MSAKDRETLFQHAKGVGGRSMRTEAQREALDATLTEAYHTIFDVKDDANTYLTINKGDPACRDAESIRYRAYETLQHLSRLMDMLGFIVPNRMDGDGR